MIEHWAATELLGATHMGNYYSFEDGMILHVEDWEPLRNPIQMERIREKAKELGHHLIGTTYREMLEGLKHAISGD